GLLHVLRLRPFVGRRVVLQDHSRRSARLSPDLDRIASKQIQLPVGDGALALFVGLGDRRKPDPAPLGLAATLATAVALSPALALTAAAALALRGHADSPA